MKICSKCKISQPVDCYSMRAGNNDGLQSYCKKCSKTIYQAYAKTEEGVIAQIYRGQRRNSKVRGHTMPDYTKHELKTWLYENGFYELFFKWVWSSYTKGMKPSCDRLDSLKPYALENLELVTWAVNNRRGYEDGKNGVGTQGLRCQPVDQLHPKTGRVIARFISQKEATRATGIDSGNISQAIRKDYRAGGYNWRLAEGDL